MDLGWLFKIGIVNKKIGMKKETDIDDRNVSVN